MARKTYDGAEISVHFDMKRCIHARNCFLKLPKVFDPDQRPWVQPDNAPAEEIAVMIRTCPSGALTFTPKTGVAEAPPIINRVTILENGPLAVSGDLHVAGAEAETRATLCRCGLSQNKPYCDYSHVVGGFTATGEPQVDMPGEDKDKGGPLTADTVPDGPLRLTGHMEITTGTGHRVAKVAKAFLCRCGQSQNKPFCDGSHKAAGFTD